MTFHNVKLEWGYDYGVTGGPEYRNTSLRGGDGHVQTIVHWENPLGRWSLGDRVVDYREAEYLKSFFHARQANAHSFRYLDWTDFEFNDEVVAIGDNSATYQITKRYESGGITRSRPILLPNADVTVYVRGESRLTSQVDTQTGLVTFSEGITAGQEIRAIGTFDVKVMFEQERLDGTFLAFEQGSGQRMFQLGELTLIEVR